MGFGLFLISVSCLVSFSTYLMFPAPSFSVNDPSKVTGNKFCRDGRNKLSESQDDLFSIVGASVAKFTAFPTGFYGVKFQNVYDGSGVTIGETPNNQASALVSYNVDRSSNVSDSARLRPWNSTIEVEPCTIDRTWSAAAYSVWFLAYSLLGIGSATVYTIGAPYLDDSVSKKDSPLYFAISIAVRIIGPVLGYLMSSACLKVYLEPFKDPGITPDDPRWIGAWWIGFLVMAVTVAIFAAIMALFPRRIKPRHEDSCVNNCSNGTPPNKDYPDDKERPAVIANLEFKDLVAAVKRLLRNEILMCSAGSSIFSVMGLVGFFIWLPKFFEHQFRISKSESSLYAGLSGSSTMIIGVLVGGWAMRAWRMSAKRVAVLVAICQYVYVIGLIGLMFCGCDYTEDLPGEHDLNGSFRLFGCERECGCGSEEFIPVCWRGSDPESPSMTLFSPCHAGCSTILNTTKNVYTDCRCVPEPSVSMNVTKGFCEPTCGNVYIYMVLLAIVKLIVSTSTIGNLIIDLRCVAPHDKAISLGFLTAASSLLGFLPNPLIYGLVIDSSCLVWEESCGEQGSCWLYDTDAFRYKLHGLTALFLAIAGIFEIMICFKVGSLQLTEDDETITSSEMNGKSKMSTETLTSSTDTTTPM